MKMDEVVRILDAKVFAGDDLLDTEVFAACGSDLMSDVLAFVKDQALLLTGLVNIQAIRTAEMMDMKAIVFVRGKRPDEAMVQLAEQGGLIILSTEHPLFIACGMLYANGLTGRAD